MGTYIRVVDITIESVKRRSRYLSLTLSPSLSLCVWQHTKLLAVDSKATLHAVPLQLQFY
jgi:hypothetical protein